MLREQFGSVARRTLCLGVLTVILVSSAGASGKYQVLHSFNCATDGCGPTGDLIFDTQGSLYGSAADTVFKLTPSGGHWTLTVLHFFNILSQGEALWAGVTFDSSGNLYGAALDGGTYDSGTAFELTPKADDWTLDVLHSFGSSNDGWKPWGELVLDESGNVYGTTQGSTVFELTPSAGGDWVENTIYSFKAKGDGYSLEAGLTWDAAGNLYGTTIYGGVITKGCGSGCGTVFELSPTSGGWKEHVLYRFKWVPGGRDGQAPYASVVFDGAGNLYGTTAGGGPDNRCGGGCGTVFKLTPSKNGHWTESVIHSFKADKNGNASFARVVLDNAGNLYGTTQRGGIGTCQGGCGVVFKLAPGSNGHWTYSVLHRFTGPDGATPNAGLTFDKAAKHLYGTTSFGGANGAGTVFEITP
jgi:uncharacterized repeat protein (TIGR03803 family)